jgi:hypothetical protein
VSAVEVWSDERDELMRNGKIMFLENLQVKDSLESSQELKLVSKVFFVFELDVHLIMNVK